MATNRGNITAYYLYMLWLYYDMNRTITRIRYVDFASLCTKKLTRNIVDKS